MRSAMQIVYVAAVVSILGSCASTAMAGVLVAGDVNPANPAAWTTTTQVFIGETGAGSATVDDDSDVVSRGSYLGYREDSSGVVTVSGVGSTWTNSGSFYIGTSGYGRLAVSGGAAVSANATSIGSNLGSTGAVIVSGAGSTWTDERYIEVGGSGNGALDIIDGGAVSSEHISVGDRPSGSGTLTISGVGSNWTGSGPCYVGHNDGNGVLNVTNGGAVNSGTGKIGDLFNSTGVVTIKDAGSKWTIAGDLTIGGWGDGELNITNGGLVEVSEYTRVPVTTWATGAIGFDNGVLTTGGFLAAAADLSGTGVINTNCLISDVDLVFDATHGMTQTLMISGPGRNITVNLDVDSSMPAGSRLRRKRFDAHFRRCDITIVQWGSWC